MEKPMIRNVFETLGYFRKALVVGLGFPFLMAVTAYAQDPAASPATPVEASAPVDATAAAATGSSATTERVIVTGSYIPTAETESALPVTTYTTEVIVKQGAQTPAEALRQLPSFVGNTVTENDSNGGDGTAAVVLRGAGPKNTLTMINGRRAFLHVGGVTFSNINAIPISAISRVEILKDGASSVYGSDAVAGVVNFILLNGPGERAYEGAEIDLLYGNTTDKDARVLHGFVRGGVVGMDGRFNIVATGEYYDRESLMSRDRTIAASANRQPLGGNNQGSPTFPGRITYRTNAAVNASAQASVLIDPSTADPMGGMPSPDYRKFDAAGPGTDPARFNFRATTPAIPAQEKYYYYIASRYKVFGEGLQLYGDMMYAKTKQDNGLAGAPFGINIATANASPYNPFIGTSNDDPAVSATYSDNQLRSVLYRVHRETGLRSSYFDYDYWRYTFGVNGDFNAKDNQFVSNWGYDAGYIFHRTDQLRIDRGDLQATPLFAEIAAGNFNPFVGTSGALSGTINTYTDGMVTGTQFYDNVAAAQRASYIGRSFFYERNWLIDAKVYAQLFPDLYQGGVGANVGFEVRNSRTSQIPDPVQVAGDQLGFNASPLTKYYQRVESFFGELRLPLIISTQNVPMVRSLELAFALRYEEFTSKDLDVDGAPPGNQTSIFNNDWTPRIAIRYQPVDWVLLRASWSESFTSPFPFQLFDPVAQNFPQISDPTTGAPPAQPAQGVWQGGNPDLKPETTESYSAGIVLTPPWVAGLTLTVDFYQIFTKNVILSGAEFAQILASLNVPDPDGYGGGSGTIDGPGGPAVGITRDDTGTLEAIDSLTSNAGKRLINGMDVSVVYQIPTQALGQFTIALGYNYFFTWKAEPSAGAGLVSFLGDFNATIPLAPGAIPYHKGFIRGEWAWHGFTFVATGNYISSYWDDPTFVLISEPLPGSGPGDVDPPYTVNRRVSSYETLDMQLSYEFKKPAIEPAAAGYTKDAKDAKSAMTTEVAGADNGTFAQRMIWGTTFRVGVNNAFDRTPPTTLGAFNDNYDTSLYSIRNRFYYLGLNKKF